MALPNDTGSLLVITALSGSGAFSLPPFSAVGINQTLEPLDQSENIMRSVIGNLIDMTNTQFRLYKTTVTCTWTRAPVLSKAWQGMIVTMECACEISWLTGDAPERDIVDGTERVSGHYTFGRPVLTVMITGIRHGFDEWKADYSWQLDAEEVGPGA